MKRLLVALGFLTRLPVPGVVATTDDFAAAIRYYPVAGLVVGLSIVAADWCGAWIDPWTGACAALVAWVAITGALHLDGLADVADGLGAAHGDRARLVAVMAEPQVGSFGVVTITTMLIAKLVLLHAVAPTWPLLVIPFAARIGPLVWAQWLPPLTQGIGARVARAVRMRDIVGWLLVLAGGVVDAPFLIVTPVLIGGYAMWVRRRLGGINGDAHGAGIEIVEIGLLVAMALFGAR